MILSVTALWAQDGKKLYLSQCAYCHGPLGEGGRGAPLNRPRLRQAPDEEALRRVIRRGIDGTGMPASWLTDPEVKLVAAHVRKLGQVSMSAVPGDPRRGEELYRSRGGCVSCHTVGGRGGALGPDLSTVGERRSAAHLRESLMEPGADIAAGYFEIRASPLQGRVITGVRVNEDTFSIQIRGAGGQVHSLWKAELASLTKELTKSPMPSYRAFTSPELDDLVAYLAQLTEDR